MIFDVERKNNASALSPDSDAWKCRFDPVEEKAGKAVADAVRKLYDFYGKEFPLWIASLYDKTCGAFYYADSARDNESFLPDSESTCQTLAMLGFLGMFPNPADAIPDEDKPKLIKFIADMQDPEDGYFYHKQWGKSIPPTRKGRDLSQCIELLALMGEKPKYPTALERLAVIAASDKKVATAMPAHLLSKEAMTEYLDKLCELDSHSVGHTLSSQADQIRAAGLFDFVCDYLDRRQNPETGLWDEKPDYTSMSGIKKLGSFYGSDRRINYAEKIIDSTIDVICSDADPRFGIYVYNPLGTLGVAVRTHIAASGNTPEVARETYAKIYARVPEIIDATIRKLSLFRKPDGSFSYEQQRSAPRTQGVPVSLGLFEGDVNGTAVAVHYLLSALSGTLGIPAVPMFNKNDCDRFMAALKK